MRRVLFISKNSPYNAGDIAGFDDDHAARLVAGGVAQYDDDIVTPQEPEENTSDSGEATTETSAVLEASLLAKPEETPRRPGRPARG